MNIWRKLLANIFLAGLAASLLLGALESGRAQAQTPSTYTVQPGDTLL